MGRVRELEKGHVGFCTKKYCIKRSLGKSALEQKGLSCYIVERERERERGFIGFGEERDREIVCIRGII